MLIALAMEQRDNVLIWQCLYLEEADNEAQNTG